jgi:hypothetical protein
MDSSRVIQNLEEFVREVEVEAAKKKPEEDEGGSGTSDAVRIFVGGVLGLIVAFLLV